MSYEVSETQGGKPVPAVHLNGAIASVEQSDRRVVTADSFRRLTALLKKPVIIPDLVPVSVAPAQEAPVSDVIAAAPAALESIAIEPVSEIIAEPAPQIAPLTIQTVSVEPVQQIKSIEPVTPIAAIAPVSIEPVKPIATIEPVSIQPVSQITAIEPISPIAKIEPIAAAPVMQITPLAIEPISQIMAIEPVAPAPVLKISEIALVAPKPVEVSAQPSLPIIAPEPEEIVAVAIEPIAEKPKSSIRKVDREKPRDAFALPPSALTKPKAPAVIVPAVQTPEQEQESAELARSLLDMMASGASSGLPQERALAADTLLRMLPRLPMKSLIMLAERLCMMEAPPQLLMAKLICDSRIEIAGPLLEECMHITDEDLSTVIHDGNSAKNRMIARRRRINRTISTQLIHTREPSVLLTLARNVGAEIPHESFAEFVMLAGEQTELLAPLCIRPDLPVPYAFELFWPAPAQLRRYLLSRFLTDSATLTKILKITLDTGSEEPSTNDFPNPDDVKKALQLWHDGQQDEACDAFASLAKIHAGTATKILSDKPGDALTALLKTLGVSRSEVGEIMERHLSTAGEFIDPPRDPEELQSLFDSLSFNKARILLTYWDWSTTQTGPYAPLN